MSVCSVVSCLRYLCSWLWSKIQFNTIQNRIQLTDLTDDCLILVFSHLPLFDRVKAEQVCQKWRTLMPYSDICTLDVKKDVPWPRTWTYVRCIDPFVLESALHVGLKRCGAFLKELMADKRIMDLPTPIFHAEAVQYIASLCPNLTKLDLSGSWLHHTCMPFFVNAWPKLRYFGGLNFSSFNGEYDLPLLSNFEGIQESFEHFLTSHPHIEELHLRELPFVPMLTNPKLRVLHLSDAEPKRADGFDVGPSVSDDILINLIESCRGLEVLELYYCHGISDFKPISNLLNLKELSVPRTLLNNEGLAKICQNCQNIFKLDISDPLSVCDGGTGLTNLEPLGLLKKLFILNVSGVCSFNNCSLYQIARHGMIQQLRAVWCSLTNDGVKYLATYCQNLKVVHLSSKEQVSDEGILFLVENCKKLKCLHICHCKVTNELLACVGSAAQGLEELLVYGCVQGDQYGFEQLFQNRKRRIEGGESLPHLKLATFEVFTIIISYVNIL